MDRWEWPGARWWRCDLHLHTPRSHDFKDENASAADWVTSAIAAGLEAVAITDHDSAAMISEIQADSRVVAGDLVVFPGVELTSIEGVHLLVLLEKGATEDAVKAILGACGIPGAKWGKPDARASKTFSECMEIATKDHGGLCIAPHADAIPSEENSCKASLLVGINDNSNLELALSSPYLAAAEICQSDPGRHDKLRGTPSRRMEPGLSLVRFSDAHTLSEIGRRSTWIKMTEPSIEGLRLAFTDGDRSVREHSDQDRHPNQPPGLAIESLTVTRAKHIGRSESLEVKLSPWLNALIGGRGAGKSSLVELMRLVLGRGSSLPPGIQETHDRFALIYRDRQDLGALTPDTEVALTYRKDGTRFRATWASQDSGPHLEEEDQGSWGAAEGSVRRRLPVQIYSQNEINEVAKDPRALLSIVNQSTDVDHDKWLTAFTSKLTSFLAFRARARDLESSVSAESEARGELADTIRQVETFEGTEHDKILKEHQRFQKQGRAIERWEQEIESSVASLREFAARLQVDSLPTDLFDASVSDDRPVLEAAGLVASEIKAAREVASNAADDLAAEATRAKAAIQDSEWATARDRSGEQYKGLAAKLGDLELGEQGGFDALLLRRQSLEEQLADIDQTKQRREIVSKESAEALIELEENRRDLSVRRSKFLLDVLGDNALVRVHLDEMGDREDASESLRKFLGLGDSFGDDLDNFVRMIFEGKATIPEGLSEAKKILRELSEADEPEYQAADKRFITRVKRLTPETLDRLDAWFPDDLLRAEFSRTNGGSFEPIDRGSTGQQNAAILAFLLSYGDEPIIIDQPENDLDNRLISDLVVRSLIASKKRRQLVVVTHNPNLVVNGDAEFVVSMDIPAGEVKIQGAGGLQEGLIREEVCEVMEGGREAFELRYSRIGKKSAV
jgi:AAA domain, putative AbiEii toxin, Type IV TA system